MCVRDTPRSLCNSNHLFPHIFKVLRYFSISDERICLMGLLVHGTDGRHLLGLGKSYTHEYLKEPSFSRSLLACRPWTRLLRQSLSLRRKRLAGACVSAVWNVRSVDKYVISYLPLPLPHSVSHVPPALKLSFFFAEMRPQISLRLMHCSQCHPPVPMGVRSCSTSCPPAPSSYL